MNPTIALDAMGGDHGVSVVAAAAHKFLQRNSKVNLILVGDSARIQEQFSLLHLKIDDSRLSIHHASQVVAMDEAPSSALRNKKDSSMRVAIDLVKQGKANACVSAGNTGALMATARFVLKTLPGIDRPAIMTALPTMRGHCHMLDLGANIESSAQHLLQFAVMGSVLVSAVDKIERPTIGLLNIGEEEIKGSEEIKKAAALISASGLNYKGFVEGDDIYRGKVDVVVCDGFVGNVSLKSSEGLARMITHFLRVEFTKNIFTKIAALVAMPVLNSLKRRIDPGRYNGASLAGLQGIVIKSHGNADVDSFTNAIDVALREIESNVLSQISNRVGELLVERQAV